MKEGDIIFVNNIKGVGSSSVLFNITINLSEFLSSRRTGWTYPFPLTDLKLSSLKKCDIYIFDSHTRAILTSKRSSRYDQVLFSAYSQMGGVKVPKQVDSGHLIYLGPINIEVASVNKSPKKIIQKWSLFQAFIGDLSVPVAVHPGSLSSFRPESPL